MRISPVCMAGLLAIIMITLLGSARAQDGPVTVEGVVWDEGYRALRDVTIRATDSETGFERTARPDDRGYFNLGQLPAGTYRFRITNDDGEILMEESYRIGEKVMTGSDGEPTEQLVVLLGRGIHSLGQPPSAARKPAKSRLTRRMVSGSSRSWIGNVNGLLGLRALDDDFWSPVDDQWSVGVDVDFGRAGWPVRPALGFHFSQDEKRERVCFIFCSEGPVLNEGKVFEFDIGIVTTFGLSKRTRPFLGGGIALVKAELDIRDSGSADDTSNGAFVRAGIYWVQGTGCVKTNLGFELKLLSGTNVVLLDEEGSADYVQLAFLFGIGW